jgi:hypothetical protein
MIGIDDVADALYGRLGATFAGLPVAYPEPAVAFDPPADGRYLRAAILPNAPRNRFLGRQTVDQGLLQVTVVWPRNASELPAWRIAKQVCDHFNVPRLNAGGVRVQIDSGAYTASPLTFDDRIEIPVTIAWSAV